MRIYITTKINQKPDRVFSLFNKELFLALVPPGLKVQLLRFDGCKTGDEVHLLIKFPFAEQKWFSKITAHSFSDSNYSFIDEGIELPFFIKQWKHIHTVKSGESDNCSEIIDDISFESGSIIIGWLVYPFLYFTFLYRRPIYKQFLDV
ncbi:hypothetical protein NF867_07170 [Solitalea sp. MAHUQ-68]|uniref:Ligand-binding SRPBCC domain-containing protein n=1 Tax=Solitalea agri TaxID=2953739 RepID=A0A9X2F5C7_9SPHI|nr:hypothetical protein [Solitalea agri]MCO4292636.1 hypothetical protein [Solitalea agri]